MTNDRMTNDRMTMRLLIAASFAALFTGCGDPAAHEGAAGAPGANQVTLLVPGMNQRLKLM